MSGAEKWTIRFVPAIMNAYFTTQLDKDSDTKAGNGP